MGQIMKRKKKGRPSKADLAKSGSSPSAITEKELRRSHRRRNVRYCIDYDDYEDFLEVEDEEEEDEEEDDEEEERRREKKLKLLLKLNQGQETELPVSSTAARNRHAVKEKPGDEEEEESARRNKMIKKIRINGGEEKEEEEDDDDDEDYGNGDGDEEMKGRKGESRRQDSDPGTPSDPPLGIPLPDKKTLELILDKLQKKDIYGVYAEPVDPEELPDYHDIIEHPMDFSTVRKKLRNESYSTFEQFKSDVFLICSNAMQYNSEDTIYYKQARSIQELAKKKFEKLKIDVELSGKDRKMEQKTKSNFLEKKQTKKHLQLTTQEPVGSDFSSGATLATAGNIPKDQNSSITIQANACERPSHADALLEGNTSLPDYNLEKNEELSSGNGLLSKFGKKTSTFDDNRRATYVISNQPVARSESIFTTFEAEIRQLVTVGIQAEYSYARSLARFAATLGPLAWKVASRRIEQALPMGCKFGRGWVVEYEPLTTPVLTLDGCASKETALLKKLQPAVDVQEDYATYKTLVPATGVQKDDVICKAPLPAKPHPLNVPVLEGKSYSLRAASGSMSEGRQSLFDVAGSKPGKPVNNSISQQQSLPPRTYAQSENKVPKQVELNLPPKANQNSAYLIAEKKSSNILEKAASKPEEIIARKMCPALSSKQMENSVAVDGGLPNGKISSNCFNNRAINSSSDNTPTQMAKSAAYYFHGQEQSLSDPVQFMRISAEKAQKKQISLNQFSADTPPALGRDDSSCAASASASAARAWMSIGAGGFKQATESSGTLKGQISAQSSYNPARELHSQVSRVGGAFPLSDRMQFQPQPQKDSSPFHAFPTHRVRLANEAQFQDRAMVFPQLGATDLSRFQMQSPLQGLSPRTQSRQNQDMLPPNFNIGFQSPAKQQSSGVLVDSQEPDLALQL